MNTPNQKPKTKPDDNQVAARRHVLQFAHRSVYGNDRYTPMNDNAHKAVKTLRRKRVLTPEDIVALNSLLTGLGLPNAFELVPPPNISSDLSTPQEKAADIAQAVHPETSPTTPQGEHNE